MKRNPIVKIEFPGSHGSWGFVCCNIRILERLNELDVDSAEPATGDVVRFTMADGSTRVRRLPSELLQELFPFRVEWNFEKVGTPEWVLSKSTIGADREPHPVYRFAEVVVGQMGYSRLYADRDSISVIEKLQAMAEPVELWQLDARAQFTLRPWEQTAHKVPPAEPQWFVPLAKCLSTLWLLDSEFDED